MKNSKTRRLTVFFVTVVMIITMILAYSKDVANNLTLGLDLQGGFEILYEVSPLEDGGQLPDMSAVAKSISKRVNVLGVSEPQIIIEGDNRIRVQLAGVKDQEQARRMISSTANLTFRDVNDNELSDASIIKEGGASLAYQDGKPIVSLKISDPTKFGDLTEQVAQMPSGTNLMVVWLDYSDGDSYVAEVEKQNNGQEPKFISSAAVNFRIDGDCIIQGNFSEAEARELADLINSGSLPVKMSEISSNVVSAEYGINAFETTQKAGIVGVCLVLLFMIFIYRLPGIISSIMLSVYLFAVFAIYSAIGAVFTLPGIAALVLGVGMTVDANIITFERIKDELYLGRSIQSAVKEGQQLSFSTIFDAQFTTLLAGLIMYIFGNGAVKGFATMLMITVICTLIFNVVVSRFLLKQIVLSGALDNKYSWFAVKKANIPDVAKNESQFYYGPIKKIDYVKHAIKFNLTSIVIIVIATLLLVFNAVSGKGALNLGIDFSSGTKITISSTEQLTEEAIKDEFKQLGYDSISIQFSGTKTAYATINQALEREELNKIKDSIKELTGIEPVESVVTPTVGKDLVRNAIYLSLLAWVAMLAYITIRFKWDYAISCIVALLHDVFIVLAIFTIFRFEINTELISVILAIIGYSINNSIVVFDRIRENVNALPKGKKIHAAEYQTIVNSALDNTIVRSVLSSITTLLPIIALLAIGSSAIFTFTFAMFIGLIAGTISSIFVAPQIWLYIRTHYQPKAKKAKKKFHEELDELPVKGINF